MRKAFHEELDRVAETLVEMTHLASSAMNRATTALLDADIHLADSVIAADAEIDARRAELDLMSFDLLARQQPVATDLRVIVTSMRMSSDIERMGDRARHVAKVARLRYPASAVPALVTSISAMCPASRNAGRTSWGTAWSGKRMRATLAMCSARSPMRSRSLAIRVAVTIVRRSVATGCWRASSVKQRWSMLSRVASICSSPAITRSASVTSASSRAVVAVLICEPTEFAMSTSEVRMSSSSSR
jgi:hypothetical protein